MAASTRLGVSSLPRRRSNWCTEREPLAVGALPPGGWRLARVVTRGLGLHYGRIPRERLRVDVERYRVRSNLALQLRAALR